MMTRHIAAVLATLTAAGACGDGPAASTTRLRDSWGPALPGLVARYQLADALERDGRGRSDATTSGGLGWSESAYLRRYMMCFGVTRDPYWLDKVIDHADRMFANLTDHDGDGFRSWQDRDYSVGLVELASQGDVGDVVVAPVPVDGRVYVGRGGERITGHVYVLAVIAPGRLSVTDQTEGRMLSGPDGVGTGTLDLIPGVALRVSGQGVTGARIEVRTRAPEPCEYQVHDGMVAYPLALFVEQVLADAALPPAYAVKAREYLGTLHRHFVQRWEKTWRDVPPDAGLYLFTDNPTQRFPGYSLPHNQYLAPARALLVLSRIPDYEGAGLCAERARRMAVYFRRSLRPTENGAYVWNYWDPLPHEAVARHIEDAGHGTIDIGFAAEAVRRGVVFTRDDLERLAKTYVDVMWDGNRDNPRFGRRVDSAREPQTMWSEWLELAAVDLRVWDLAAASFEYGRRPVAMVPALAEVYDRLVGVSNEQRRQCRANTESVLRLVHTAGLLNPGFEAENPGGDGPAGWTLGAWSPDAGGVVEWVRDAHEGERAIALTGKGDTVNVWAQSVRELRVPGPGQVARITAWYKAEAGTRPTFSVLAFDRKGGRVQYDTSPAFPASAVWRLAEWRQPLTPEAVALQVMLRNHACGRVTWDQVDVAIAPAVGVP